MKAITIRLDENVLDIIEERRGLKQRADFIRDIIDTYFLKSDSDRIAGDSQANLNEIANLKKELEHSEIRIADLQAQIDLQRAQAKTLENQLGFLQLEYQKMTDRLMLPAPGRSWWQFWK